MQSFSSGIQLGILCLNYLRYVFDILTKCQISMKHNTGFTSYMYKGLMQAYIKCLNLEITSNMRYNPTSSGLKCKLLCYQHTIPGRYTTVSSLMQAYIKCLNLEITSNMRHNPTSSGLKCNLRCYQHKIPGRYTTASNFLSRLARGGRGQILSWYPPPRPQTNDIPYTKN